jgi:hypothetical protein
MAMLAKGMSMKVKVVLSAVIAVNGPPCPIARADLLVSGYNNNAVLRYNQTTGACEGVFPSGGH